MECLSDFFEKKYIQKADSRLSAKNIYNDFRQWIINKYGVKIWNTIGEKEFYNALKNLSDYTYVRYKEGYCLKGIDYKKDNFMESNVSTSGDNQESLPTKIANAETSNKNHFFREYDTTNTQNKNEDIGNSNQSTQRLSVHNKPHITILKKQNVIQEMNDSKETTTGSYTKPFTQFNKINISPQEIIMPTFSRKNL